MIATWSFNQLYNSLHITILTPFDHFELCVNKISGVNNTVSDSSYSVVDSINIVRSCIDICVSKGLVH
jgi:hypothetical protein